VFQVLQVIKAIRVPQVFKEKKVLLVHQDLQEIKGQ
jgi:hypothetical protein